MKNVWRARQAFVCALLLLLTIPGQVHATEGGGTAYAAGINTELAAFVPLPGQTQFQMYLLGLNATKLAGPDGKSSLPGFHLQAAGTSLRVLHTWNFTLNDFHFTSGIAPVFETVNLRVPGASYNATGANELYIQPLIVTRNFGSLNLLLSQDFYVPIGQHTPGNPASTSVGYYAPSTSFAVTWLPDRYWDFSAFISYTTPFKDSKTGYQSGNTLNIDYGVTYRPWLSSMPQLGFGLNGYFTKQLTDDTVSGVPYNNGNRLQQFAIGPHITWFVSAASGISLKFQHEMLSRNTAQGNKVWLEFFCPI
jgi:hypothetical protein